MSLRARTLCFGLLAACSPSAQGPAPALPTPAAAAAPHDEAEPAPGEAGACRPVPLPDTPVGRRATALLDVIDRGDRGEIEALVTEQLSPGFQQRAPLAMHLEVLGGLHDETGGVTVCRVEHAGVTEAVLLLAPAKGDGAHVMTVRVEDAAPHRLSDLSIDPVGRAALDDPPAPLDDAARRAIVEGVATALGDYVHADVAAAMQAHIRAEESAGRYATLTHPLPLARQLTKDLRAVSKDGHLAIFYSASVVPPDPPESRQAPSPAELEEQRAQAAREGFGLAKVEVLAGNIGYIDIRVFHPVDIAREAISAAMTRLAGTKALIVDLRLNHGGDPATVAFMTSYLFGTKKVHLNDLYYRRTNETIEYWTDPTAPGERFGPKKPVYVLTSNDTFSAGEEFTYNLRALARATIVGEVTGGGAHPVTGVRVDDHIMAIVPVGRAINPRTKTNWEGTGVEPHVAVPASEALDRALAMIAGKAGKAATPK